ncbi:MAG: YgiQ family radical SAM protein [Muribaculaceae bacterium]|nr:YgiQ family radical SAM protein [Muribaculaceae bacterium]
MSRITHKTKPKAVTHTEDKPHRHVGGEVIDYPRRPVTDWLPTSVKEMKARGWDEVDIVLFSGDAYIDHPSFGAAVLGRLLVEVGGYKVAIVPQPNWQDDLRDFRKFGRPRLFFGVSAGAMDSMVNHYTAARRRRSDDAYTPDGRHGMRPDYPTIVYSEILKKLYPDVPVIAGGIEASLRRLSHYDYWQDRLRPSILADSAADMIIYGMGELPILELSRRLDAGQKISEIRDIPQTVFFETPAEMKKITGDITPMQGGNVDHIILNSWEDCRRDKRMQVANFKHIEQQSNRFTGATLWQPLDKERVVRVNPMYPPMTAAEIDRSFDLNYTRLPHPRYLGKRIPAFDMIKYSVNLHRGCFGGCAFCTISAHQGKFIASRSKESVMKEVRKVTAMPGFKGYISDLGGPSANMYAMSGRDKSVCARCLRPSCLHPKPCPNLNTDHRPLLDIYHSVDALPEVKKSFIGSGVRYDLSLHKTGDKEIDAASRRYNEELITSHVSGRLKVAPEHTEDDVLDIMRKPSFDLFEEFKQVFDRVNAKNNLRQQLIPYFISSHPGCREIDMANLAVKTKRLDFRLEQVQDFTPTPMTVATEIYYSGYHPYTMQRVFTAITPEEKLAQRQYFFWYDRTYRSSITASLNRLHRPDLIRTLFAR